MMHYLAVRVLSDVASFWLIFKVFGVSLICDECFSGSADVNGRFPRVPIWLRHSLVPQMESCQFGLGRVYRLYKPSVRKPWLTVYRTHSGYSIPAWQILAGTGKMACRDG